MRMVQILDFEPRPGEVVEFAVTCEQAPVRHGVPASYLQREHLRMAAAHRLQGRRQSPWVALAFDLPGRADLAALASALTGLIRRHEAFHTRYELDGDGLAGFRYDPESITVIPDPVGYFGDPGALRICLHRRIEEETALGWPALLAGVIRRPDVSTVYFAIDHTYTDGYSMALLFEELSTRYRAAVDLVPVDLPPVAGYLDYNRREHERAGALAATDAELDDWAEFLAAGDGGLPGFPVDLGNASGDLLPGLRFQIPLFTGAQASEFREYCARNGGGFGAGAFAALAIAQQEFTGNDVYRVLTVVSTRAYPRLLQVHGWLVNLVPLLFRVPASGGFAATIGLAQQGFQRARAGYDVPLHRAIELLAGTGQDLRIPPMVSYLDGRAAPGAGDYLSADTLLLAGPDSALGVSLWFNWFPDRAELAVSMPDTPQARAGVPEYLDRVREIMLGPVTGRTQVPASVVSPGETSPVS